MCTGFSKSKIATKWSHASFQLKKVWCGLFYYHGMLQSKMLVISTTFIFAYWSLFILWDFSTKFFHVPLWEDNTYLVALLHIAYLVASYCLWFFASTRFWGNISLLLLGVSSILLIHPLCAMINELTTAHALVRSIVDSLASLIPNSPDKSLSAIPSMVSSVAFIMLIKGIFEWMKATPVKILSHITVLQLGWHKKHIALFVFMYFSYTTYWLQGHHLLLYPYAIVTILTLVIDASIIHYPVWSIDTVVRSIVQYVMLSIPPWYWQQAFSQDSASYDNSQSTNTFLLEILEKFIGRLEDVSQLPHDRQELGFSQSITTNLIDQICQMKIPENHKALFLFSVGLCSVPNTYSDEVEHVNRYMIQTTALFHEHIKVDDEQLEYIMIGFYCGTVLMKEKLCHDQNSEFHKWMHQFIGCFKPKTDNGQNMFQQALQMCLMTGTIPQQIENMMYQQLVKPNQPFSRYIASMLSTFMMYRRII